MTRKITLKYRQYKNNLENKLYNEKDQQSRPPPKKNKTKKTTKSDIENSRDLFTGPYKIQYKTWEKSSISKLTPCQTTNIDNGIMDVKMQWVNVKRSRLVAE